MDDDEFESVVARTARALRCDSRLGRPVPFRPDIDHIAPLSTERDALWKRRESASFLTDAEKRAAVGYGAK
jgi:phage portal protein BeeE